MLAKSILSSVTPASFIQTLPKVLGLYHKNPTIKFTNAATTTAHQFTISIGLFFKGLMKSIDLRNSNFFKTTLFKVPISIVSPY